MASEPDLHTTSTGGTGDPRPGHDLRAARERAGVSLESMAERLRLSVAQLEALELDDYAELPPPAFVRGYLRAYARDLGLEPEAYVSAYDATSVSDHDPELRLTSGIEAPAGGRGALIGLLLIVLVAGGGIGAWWYQQRMAEPASTVGAGTTESGESAAAGGEATQEGGTDDGAAADESSGVESSGADEAGTNGANAGGAEGAEGGAGADAAGTTDGASTDADGGNDTEPQSASAGEPPSGSAGDSTTNPPDIASAEPASDAVMAGDPAASAAATDDAGDGDTGGGDAEAGETTADAGETGETGEPTAAAETSEPESEPGASTPDATDSATLAATSAASTGPDRIVLEFEGRSWLEVHDSRDRELMYTLYYGSDPVTLRGWAPFEVFLGNSPAVEVRFNGEPVDKSAFTRSDNTARFVVDSSGASAS